MKILIDIGHPGHVHFFKYAVWKLQDRGHDILISARNKDVTLQLLEYYRLNYRTLTTIATSKLSLFREFIVRELSLIRLMHDYKPDITTGIGGEFIAPVSKVLGIPCVVFTDTETASIDNILTYPIANVICTPMCFSKNVGRRQIRYDGYHELAYLSPTYFQPDPNVLNEVGISEDEPYTIIRLVAWKASHDIGRKGISRNQLSKIVSILKGYGKVFITSENSLPSELEPYKLKLPPHRIHDLIHYSQLLIGEGATMATEAGILGTPSIFSSPVAPNLGNFHELMERYKLVYSYTDLDEALIQAVRILESPDSKRDWQVMRDNLLAEKIDVTAFIIQILENYPTHVRHQVDLIKAGGNVEKPQGRNFRH